MIYFITILILTAIGAIVTIARSIPYLKRVERIHAPIPYSEFMKADVIELRHHVEFSEDMLTRLRIFPEEAIAGIDRDSIELLNRHVRNEIKIWDTGHLSPLTNDNPRHIVTRHYFLRILKKS